jgi:hemerythrin-like domain-containing protein
MSIRISPPAAIGIIEEEHKHLSTVIDGLLHIVRAVPNAETPPDLSLCRAMLYFIIHYPERVHHPKEDRYLFAKIQQRTHQLDSEIDALVEQHANGELLAHRLLDALLAVEFDGLESFPHFHALVEQYVHFYHAHMRTEEEQILPVASQILNEADWQVIDNAFLENRQKTNETGERYRYDQLFSRIINSLPDSDTAALAV